MASFRTLAYPYIFVFRQPTSLGRLLADFWSHASNGQARTGYWPYKYNFSNLHTTIGYWPFIYIFPKLTADLLASAYYITKKETIYAIFNPHIHRFGGLWKDLFLVFHLKINCCIFHIRESTTVDKLHLNEMSVISHQLPVSSRSRRLTNETTWCEVWFR